MNEQTPKEKLEKVFYYANAIRHKYHNKSVTTTILNDGTFHIDIAKIYPKGEEGDFAKTEILKGKIYINSVHITKATAVSIYVQLQEFLFKK